MFKNTPYLSEQMLQNLYYALQEGAIHIFSGSEPANATDALEMMNDHTHLCTLTLDGNPSTGLELDSPNGHLISIPASAVWQGLIAFEGAQASATALTPSFSAFADKAMTDAAKAAASPGFKAAPVARRAGPICCWGLIALVTMVPAPSLYPFLIIALPDVI